MKLGRWRNTAYQMSEHLWMLLLWAGTTPVFIWYLGEEVFGVWILVNAVVGMGGVMSFGFGEATTRYVALYRGQSREDELQALIGTTLGLYICVGAVFSLALYLAAPWLASVTMQLSGEDARQAEIALRLAAAALMLTTFLRTWEAAINGFERYDVTARIGMLARSFIILGNLALVLLGFGLTALMACTVLGLLGQALACLLMLRRLLPGVSLIPRISWRITQEIAGFGVQSWLQICGGALNTMADRFLVSAVLGPAAAGVYVICMQLAQQINLLIYRGLAFLMPETSRGTGGSQAVLEGYRGGALLVLLLSGAVALPMIVLAEQLLELWVGRSYAEQGAQTLRIMACYFALFSAFVPMFFLVNGSGRPVWNTLANILHGVAGLVAAYAFLPVLGLDGAALGRLSAIPALLFILWALHSYVLGGVRGSFVITLSMMLWLAVLGACAWGLHGFISPKLPATFLVLFGMGLLLSAAGGALALVPWLWLRRLSPR